MFVHWIQTVTRRYVPLTVSVLLLSGGSELRAQVMVSPAFKTNATAEAVVEQPTKKTIQIHAAKEPDPAFRYRLWPAPEKRRLANPMPFVSRAILMSVQAGNSQAARTDYAERYDAFTELSIDELPKDKVRELLAIYGADALSELKRAENLMGLDYDLRMDELTASQMISTLLPEFQEMRGLARLLSLRARLAIAENRWDDMVDDLRLGFRLAEFAGHGNDFLVARLVGYAINGLMMNVVEEAIQRPECPNLYWAIVSLPENRLFEIRDSIEFESVLVTRLFRSSGPLPDTAIGEVAARERLRELIQEATRTMTSMNSLTDERASAQMVAGLYVVTMAEPSRKLLAGTDQWRDQVNDLSDAEAVLRSMLLKFERVRDDWTKWALLPDELWDKYKANSETGLKQLIRTDILESLILQLTPAVDAARTASRRTRQTRNVLLTIEAIRMHASISGELPKSLENLQPVPAWSDEMTLSPFGYGRASPTNATLLRAPRWPGDRQTTVEITLIK